MASHSQAPADIEQIKVALQRSPMLRALMEVAPEVMQAALRDEFHKAGSVLFREGEPGDRVYAIWTGRLRVQHDKGLAQPVVLRDCFPGDVVGEIALLDNQPRSATVLAAEDTRLVSLSREDFKQIVAQRPDIMVDLLRALSYRLRSSSDFIVATTRTVDQLTAQLARTGQSQKPGEDVAAEHMWHGLYDLFQNLNESAQSAHSGIDTLRQKVMTANMPERHRKELEDLFSLVASHAGHTLHSVQESQALMRLQSGEFSLNRTSVMIGELCDVIASKLTPLARLRGVSFDVRVAANLPKLFADQSLLDLTLRRLMNMLIQTAPQGSQIEVEVDSRFDREVQIAIRNREGFAVPEEYHELIFTPFFTLPEMPGSGHGLELAAVRAVIQAHGGDVIARAGSDGEGTQFVLRLPTGFDQYDGADGFS